MENVKIDKKSVIKWIGRILSIASIIFIGVKIYQLGFGIEKIENIPLFSVAFVIAVILKTLSVLASGLAWAKWVRFFTDQKLSYSEMLAVYGKANIGKYLPGNVMHYVERNLFAARYGLPQKKIVFATVAETLELLIAAVLIIGVALPRVYRQKVWALIADRKIIVYCLLAVILITLLVAIVLLARKKWSIQTKGLFGTSILTMIGYLTTLILLGAGMLVMWMFCSAKLPTWDTVGLIIAAFATAWVCGFVVPGASGGIGIREAILLLLLEGIASESVLLFIIVLHRIATVVGDFLVYVGILLAGRKQKGTEKE